MDQQKQLPATSQSSPSAQDDDTSLFILSRPAPNVRDLEKKVTELQEKNTFLARSLRAKAKPHRENACFNTSLRATALRKQVGSLLGENKRLKEGKDGKDVSMKKQGQRLFELEKENQNLKEENLKLKDACDRKDRKNEKLQIENAALTGGGPQEIWGGTQQRKKQHRGSSCGIKQKTVLRRISIYS